MSFIDDIVDFASSTWDWFSNSDIAMNLAGVALTGFAVNQLNKNVNPKNEATERAERAPAVDPGVRLQVDPDPEHSIPVVYGQAFLGGIVTDAALVNDNKSMFFCLTLCEKTGTKFSDSQQSQFTFGNIYWDDQKITFDSSGTTIASTTDRDGNVSTNLAGLVQIFCYNGSSSDPVLPFNVASGSLLPAYTRMPDWTVQHVMSDLIFAIVRVDYNKENNCDKLGDIKFELENSMTLPGDCLYDMMTNTRYGAGIAPTEIYQA